mgnify:CR=1 FL=1
MPTTIDRDTSTIHFEREIAATRTQVFDAWTNADQVANWWDPTGARLVACEIELKPGGAFRFVNEGHGPPFTGTYVVIERPSRLVFEALGSVGTVTLEAQGNVTRMSVTIRCASQEHFEHFIRLGVASGTDQTLDNLVHYLGTKTPAVQAVSP